MIKGLIGLFGTLLLLAGCANEVTTNINYYLLDEGSTVASSENIAQRPITVSLHTFQVADYLKHANLSMQVNEHELYYSKQHFWAEPLQSSMQKVVLHDLNENTQKAYFENRESTEFNTPDFALSVNITHFSPTYDSYVVLSGQYTIYTMKDPANSTKAVYNFNYRLALDENGYEHAVSQLRSLLSTLSIDVVKNIEKLEI